MSKISVAKDFTRFPGRFKKNGGTSGEAFRERFLESPVKSGEQITVDLDGTIGYGSSFLEEAFGGLVRSLNISSEIIKSRLDIVSNDPALLQEVYGYIDEANKGSN